MAGLLMGGIGTIFYVVLLVGMVATKLWEWALGWIHLKTPARKSQGTR